jgi:HAD superfamily hydrolase (TIGR01450 family)
VSGQAAAGPPPRQAPGLRGCPRPLTEAYDTALLDLDGVVYLGGTPIPGAAAALAKAASGMSLAYVTNNASRTPRAIGEQLAAMGVPVQPGSVITSAQAAARILSERLPRGSSVLVVGGTGLRQAVRERGLRPVTTARDRPAAVVQGYQRTIDYPLLAEGALAVAAGALFVASNADATLPSTRGRQPGNGALVQVIATATGRDPVVAGKPEPSMHKEMMLRTGAQRPLIVGDRLDTDIEGANRADADSLLVLTGVSRPSDVVLAPARQRPSYLAAGLDGLLEPHPVPTGGAGEPLRCNGWQAHWVGRGASGTMAAGGHEATDGARIELTGSGDPVDALRLLCAACWPRDGVTPAAIADALRAAGLG